jgi:hypothetical protein
MRQAIKSAFDPIKCVSASFDGDHFDAGLA